MENEHIAIAKIGKPVGLKGWCRVYSYGRTLEHLKLPITLAVGRNSPECSVTLEYLQKDGKGWRAHFSDYSDCEAINVLKNKDMLIVQSLLPKTDPDEYYNFDLVGLTVTGDVSGKQIGTVECVHNFPTLDALELKCENGEAILVPFQKTTVPIVDVSRKLIVVSEEIIEELLIVSNRDRHEV